MVFDRRTNIPRWNNLQRWGGGCASKQFMRSTAKVFKTVVKKRAGIFQPGMATLEPMYYIGVDSDTQHIILGEGSTPNKAWKDAMSGKKQEPL